MNSYYLSEISHTLKMVLAGPDNHHASPKGTTVLFDDDVSHKDTDWFCLLLLFLSQNINLPAEKLHTRGSAFDFVCLHLGQ